MNRIPVSQSTFFIADTQPIIPLNPPAITQLEAVKCPTLVVAGAMDHPEVLRAAEEMVKRIPNAQKTIIASSGHVPTYEQPDAFVKLLLDFLGSLK
jgi:pimeloyl-ACP methyl ester carboxylesterase